MPRIGSGQYGCPFEGCERSFSRQYNLRTHYRKHSGEKPYKCQVKSCKMSFMWRSGLINHMRNSHNEAALPSPTRTTSHSHHMPIPQSAQPLAAATLKADLECEQRTLTFKLCTTRIDPFTGAVDIVDDRSRARPEGTPTSSSGPPNFDDCSYEALADVSDVGSMLEEIFALRLERFLENPLELR